MVPLVVIPPFDGQEAFPGTIMHSKDFVTANGFDGKRVVVVGVKASGTDIARYTDGSLCLKNLVMMQCYCKCPLQQRLLATLLACYLKLVHPLSVKTLDD